jgi:hypothetical protein
VGERTRSIKPWTATSQSPAHDANLPTGYVERRVDRMPKLPVRFNDDAFVKDFLEKRFPAVKPNPMCHCDRCEYLWPSYKIDWECLCRPCRNIRNYATWWFVIVEFYRMGLPASNLETRHKWAPGTVGQVAQKIRRAAEGQRLDGLPRTGKSRGRPKSLSEIESSVESAALIKS